uniref:Coiled-coil domain containing 15 n=1 Tax=Latimeria chalumnae TaxID=7897 RepID=M3XLE5_LATCH
MLPPRSKTEPELQKYKKCARRRAEDPVPSRPKPLRLVVNQEVLAERNQAVVPVGVWVESANDCLWDQDQNQVFVSAAQVDEELRELQREKLENLKRFQDKVKRRVGEHDRIRKSQQLQKSYEAAEKEGRVVKQSSDAAERLTPKKNTCVFGSNVEQVIGSAGSHWVCAQAVGVNEEQEKKNQALQEQANMLSKAMKQARRRLASCQTVQKEEMMSKLPGGIWGVSPARDNPVSRQQTSVNTEMEEDCEELPLEGHHELPADLQLERRTQTQPRKSVAFLNEEEQGQVCERLLREPYPAGPSPGFTTDYRAALVLWPVADPEESKKQRQNQYLMYRRLFMDIEREQVKEQKRQRDHQKRLAKIKEEKRKQQQVDELRMLELQGSGSQAKESEKQAQCQLEKEKEEAEKKEKAQRNKEAVRYIEALRAQMREKIKLQNIDLPPLCCCGLDFWDSHPDTCANNCVFYKNPKALRWWKGAFPRLFSDEQIVGEACDFKEEKTKQNKEPLI